VNHRLDHHLEMADDYATYIVVSKSTHTQYTSRYQKSKEDRYYPKIGYKSRVGD
jgi:hypothetical protein